MAPHRGPLECTTAHVCSQSHWRLAFCLLLSSPKLAYADRMAGALRSREERPLEAFLRPREPTLRRRNVGGRLTITRSGGAGDSQLLLRVRSRACVQVRGAGQQCRLSNCAWMLFRSYELHYGMGMHICQSDRWVM